VTGVPEGLEMVVMRCLAKKRDERWGDVGELARALAPYGSGTWIQSADRVNATLARPLLDDTTSASRVSKNSGQQLFGLGTPQQMQIPGVPGRRNDSEFTGTASTVARRFTMFDSKKRWLFVAALAVPAVVGLGLIGLSMSAKSRAADAAAAAGSASAEPPLEISVASSASTVDVAPSGPATAVVTTGNGQASPENELPTAAPAGTLLGASPMTAKPKPATYSAPSKPAAPLAPAANTGAGKRPASSTTGTARPSLPPGLPLTRQ
jgi:hypothetical protein